MTEPKKRARKKPEPKARPVDVAKEQTTTLDNMPTYQEVVSEVTYLEDGIPAKKRGRPPTDVTLESWVEIEKQQILGLRTLARLGVRSSAVIHRIEREKIKHVSLIQGRAR